MAISTQARITARVPASLIDGLWLHLALAEETCFEEARHSAHSYLDLFLAQNAPFLSH